MDCELTIDNHGCGPEEAYSPITAASHNYNHLFFQQRHKKDNQDQGSVAQPSFDMTLLTRERERLVSTSAEVVIVHC